MPRSLYRDDEGSRGEFLKLLAQQGEEPSFLRRAKAAQGAWDDLLQRCQSDRDALLRWPRMYLGNLARQLNGDWSRLRPLLEDDRQINALQGLHVEWNGGPSVASNSSSPWSTIRGSLKEFVVSARRFNDAWSKHLQDVDLGEVNRLRTEYNAYYPIEKAAAFDCENIEGLGFVPLDIVTVEFLATIFPPLTLPVLRPR